MDDRYIRHNYYVDVAHFLLGVAEALLSQPPCPEKGRAAKGGKPSRNQDAVASKREAENAQRRLVAAYGVRILLEPPGERACRLNRIARAGIWPWPEVPFRARVINA